MLVVARSGQEPLGGSDLVEGADLASIEGGWSGLDETGRVEVAQGVVAGDAHEATAGGW